MHICQVARLTRLCHLGEKCRYPDFVCKGRSPSQDDDSNRFAILVKIMVMKLTANAPAGADGFYRNSVEVFYCPGTVAGIKALDTVDIWKIFS